MLRPHSSAPGRAPQRLATRIMRRAGWVALLAWLVALGLGLARMAEDVSEEVEAAAGLALAMAELGRLAAGSAAGADEGAAALDALLQLQRARPLRHLQLQVSDDQGRLLLPSQPLPPDDVWLGRLADGWQGMTASVGVWGGPDGSARPPRVQWSLPRPDGRHWTVTLTASPASERREAMASMLESLGLIAALATGLLLAMRWNLRRALAPLNRMLASIARIETHDTQAVQALPAMPVSELEALAAALRHLGAALESAEAQRHQLRRQVLTLQEDERARLARELHDEFGQRLTAMRVDATWVGRRLAALGRDGLGSADAAPALAALPPVVEGLVMQCAQIQQDIRGLLIRLQPFGGGSSSGSGEAAAGGHAPVDGLTQATPGEAPQRLAAMLQALAQGWGPAARAQGLHCRLQLSWQLDSDGPPQPWPEGDGVPQMPRALALALYRITQEALTNAARHAQAAEVHVQVALHGALRAGSPLRADWCVSDDGVGLADDGATASRRGNGLAGLRERVWALGGELALAPARPGHARPGLQLSASFQTQWLPPPAGHDDAPG